MPRVVTGSRLHFGLLSLAAEGASWPDAEGRPTLPARRFGGAGLMINNPGLVLRTEPADDWSAWPPELADRALTFARRFAATVASARPQRLTMDVWSPEHVGLGTGTQLGLAVAAGLAAAWGLDLPVGELARRVGRGLRSGLGVHGFKGGGLLVDAGHAAGRDDLAPLVARLGFPSEWPLVLAVPDAPPGLYGAAERRAFAELAGRLPVERTDALCRLVLLGLLPAVAERDLHAFCECLYDFNRRSGELFASAQGGVYAGSPVAEVVGWFRGQGVAGVGQSSWGPAVFAVVDDPERAERLAAGVRQRFAVRAWTARARNGGAEIQHSCGTG